MNKKEIDQHKLKLEEELSKLTGELKSIGRINPENPADWQAVPDKMDTLASDANEVADTIEDFEENTAILKKLEIRYNEIKKALQRISDGKFGVCEIGGEPIEADRLDANPAATTCKKHMN